MAQILKKNILSIVCGVVVLLAIAAYFLFVQGLYTGDGGLQAKAEERRSKYNQLNELITKSRKLPVVELETTEAADLTVFPTTEVIKLGTQITDRLKSQSDRIEALATDMNRRESLLRNFFPNPDDPQKFRFRDRYEIYMSRDLPALLQASAPPSEQDVIEAREKLWVEKYQDRIITVNNQEANREAIDAEYEEKIQGLLEQLERQTARRFRMYIEKDAINKNPRVASQDSPPTEDLWYAQTALWVQTDVAAAIAAFNDRELRNLPATEHNILNAPVKHLLKLDVPQGVDQFIAKSTTEEGAHPGAPDYKLSPTGRNSNKLYDVVRFTLVCKADTRYVTRFLQELGRGRFITVHKVNLTAVDTSLAKQDGFVYGTNPVVQVQLSGEALLFRKWTKPLVPKSVQKHLPQFEDAAPAPAEPAAETAAAQ